MYECGIMWSTFYFSIIRYLIIEVKALVLLFDLSPMLVIYLLHSLHYVILHATKISNPYPDLNQFLSSMSFFRGFEKCNPYWVAK